MSNQLILILDFGGQYNQLIARRVRECSVYCEVHSYTLTAAEIRAMSPIGIILTGGPGSVCDENAPMPDPAIWNLGIPILGICYGMQVMARELGGSVMPAEGAREFGRTPTVYNQDCKLFYGLPSSGEAWMSHGDFVKELPQDFVSSAYTDTCPNAAIANPQKKLYGLQFHPEVAHTNNGDAMLKNFLIGVCGAMGDWSMSDFSRAEIQRIKGKVGQGRVLLALSGGVDSSVTAALLERAIGDRLTCIFVDTGLMRKNEPSEIEEAFGSGSLNFVHVKAADRFLEKLAGVIDPERKRKIIGEEFIRVFEEEAKKIGAVDFLAQGTIYPDIIESGLGNAAVIKSHHNVGGLPEHVDFKDIIEPLALLFKDEVRQLGKELGLSPELVERQPFPGPGIAIRIIGEVSKERADLLRDADYIFRDEIARAGLQSRIDQYFAVLTDMKSVGVMGDARTYDCAIALRAVTTSDFMTAAPARIPYEVLERATGRIIAEVRGVNRVVYDITSKPPATIEWE